MLREFHSSRVQRCQYSDDDDSPPTIGRPGEPPQLTVLLGTKNVLRMKALTVPAPLKNHKI